MIFNIIYSQAISIPPFRMEFFLLEFCEDEDSTYDVLKFVYESLYLKNCNLNNNSIFDI